MVYVRAHARLFIRDFLGFTGVADILGVLALIAFFGSLAKDHDHPDWVWLVVFLAIALIVEMKIVHKLLAQREQANGSEAKISAKAHGQAMAELAKRMGEAKESKT